MFCRASVVLVMRHWIENWRSVGYAGGPPSTGRGVRMKGSGCTVLRDSMEVWRRPYWPKVPLQDMSSWRMKNVVISYLAQWSCWISRCCQSRHQLKQKLVRIIRMKGWEELPSFQLVEVRTRKRTFDRVKRNSLQTDRRNGYVCDLSFQEKFSLVVCQRYNFCFYSQWVQYLKLVKLSKGLFLSLACVSDWTVLYIRVPDENVNAELLDVMVHNKLTGLSW